MGLYLATSKPPKGAALLVLLAMVLMGGVGMLLGMANQESRLTKSAIYNAKLLSDAKKYLLAYSIFFAGSNDNHALNLALPCPAIDENGISAPSGTAIACPNNNSVHIGRFPWQTLGSDELRDSAGELLWYAVAGDFDDQGALATSSTTNSNLLTLNNGAGVPIPDKVVAIIFSPGSIIREGSVIQNRPRPPAGTLSTNPVNYLEDENASYLDKVFQSGQDTTPSPTPFNDTVTYLTLKDLKNNPEIIKIQQAYKNKQTISLTKNTLDNVPAAAGTAQAVNKDTSTDPNNPVVVMGDTGDPALVGMTYPTACLWFSNIPLQISASATRLFFEFTFQPAESDTSFSRDYGEGFDYVFLQNTDQLPATICSATTGSMGYHADSYAGRKSFAGEFDLYPNTVAPNNSDPCNGSNCFNHIAYLFDGNNKHTAPNPTCQSVSTSSTGCLYKPSSPIWMEDANLHWARVEIHTGFTDSACTDKSTDNGYVEIKTWIDCPDCVNTLVDSADPNPNMRRCFLLDNNLKGDPANPTHILSPTDYWQRGVIFGLTVGARLCPTCPSWNVVISNLILYRTPN